MYRTAQDRLAAIDRIATAWKARCALQQRMALRQRTFLKLMERSGRFGILSAYTTISKHQNQQRHGQLVADLQRLGLRWHDLKGQWEGVSEKSVLVPKIQPQHLFDLGRKYGQDAVIYKGGDGIVGMYYLKEHKAEVAVDPDAQPAFGMAPDKSMFSKDKNWSFELGFLWGQKLPWDGRSAINQKTVRTMLDQGGLRVQASEVVIPWQDIQKAGKKLEAVIRPFKRYEGSASAIPAGPDTGKFIAPQSGKLEVAVYGDQSHLLLGLKIGGNWFPKPTDLAWDDWDAWRAVHRKKSDMEDKLKKAADRVLIPFMKEHGLLRVFPQPQEQDGSNYSTYGIPFGRGIKVV